MKNKFYIVFYGFCFPKFELSWRPEYIVNFPARFLDRWFDYQTRSYYPEKIRKNHNFRIKQIFSNDLSFKPLFI